MKSIIAQGSVTVRLVLENHLTIRKKRKECYEGVNKVKLAVSTRESRGVVLTECIGGKQFW